jgi:hypothetical protein
MAIKVIKHGKETFKAVCPICGCEFTYQAEDLKEDCFHNHYVECPDCKQAVSHEYEAKKKELVWGKGLQIVDDHINPYDKAIPCDKKDKWFYVDYPNPNTIWSPNISDWPDCATCPNRPDPNKIIVGDTPCTWCKKNQPYCHTGDVFPKDYKGGSYKVSLDQYKNVGYTDTSYPGPAFTTNYTIEEK